MMIRAVGVERKIDSPQPTSRFFSFIRYDAVGLFQQPASGDQVTAWMEATMDERVSGKEVLSLFW